MFESVSVEFMAYMAGFAKVKVWVDGNELHYSRDVMNDTDHNTNDSVSSVPATDFIKIIEALNLLDWKKNYSPDELWMDGENWTVKYDDTEHKTYKIEGENAYPEKWTEFMDLMSEAAGHFWDCE